VTDPVTLKIDLVDSHARLRGDDVEIVLAGLSGVVADPAGLVLSRDGSTVSAPAERGTTGATHEVRARTPRGGLGDGQWSIVLAAGDTERPVDARLLVQGLRPVVLLPGAQAPRSVVPQGRRVLEVPSLGRRVVRRLARAASR
jgi:hypothetical protein